MASASRSCQSSQELKKTVKPMVTVIDSDSDDDNQYYSNYVDRRLQEEYTAGLKTEPIVLNVQDNIEIEKDDLDLSDLSDIDAEEVPFEIQLANKSRKQRETQKKQLDNALKSIVNACQHRESGVGSSSAHVNSLADLEQLQEDLAHIKYVQKHIADNTSLGCSFAKRTFDVPPIKLVKEGRVVFKINDLDDYRFCKTKLSWGIDSPFSELRKMLAERRSCSIKATSLTINNQELEDDKTPADLQLNPDMVHTVDVLTVGDGKADLPTYKCIQKNGRPISIQAEKSETFSRIAEKLREQGAVFTRIMFDHAEVPYDSTPTDLGVENDDILDLL